MQLFQRKRGLKNKEKNCEMEEKDDKYMIWEERNYGNGVTLDSRLTLTGSGYFLLSLQERTCGGFWPLEVS